MEISLQTSFNIISKQHKIAQPVINIASKIVSKQYMLKPGLKTLSKYAKITSNNELKIAQKSPNICSTIESTLCKNSPTQLQNCPKYAQTQPPKQHQIVFRIAKHSFNIASKLQKQFQTYLRKPRHCSEIALKQLEITSKQLQTLCSKSFKYSSEVATRQPKRASTIDKHNNTNETSNNDDNIKIASKKQNTSNLITN